MSRLSRNRTGGNTMGWVVLWSLVFGAFGAYSVEFGIPVETVVVGVGLGTLFVQTLFVRQRLARIEERLRFESEQAEWEEREKQVEPAGEPITPKHSRPEPPPKDDPSVSPETRLFFDHFARFADVMNERISAGRYWRLQERVDPDARPYGRCYDLFYGQRLSGEVVVREIEDHKYSVDYPSVLTVVVVWRARTYDVLRLTSYLEWLASYVAGDSPEELQRDLQNIRNAMVLAMWEVKSDRPAESYALRVAFQGPATRYLEEAEIIPHRHRKADDSSGSPRATVAEKSPAPVGCQPPALTTSSIGDGEQPGSDF